MSETMIDVPAAFAASTVAREGASGEAWLRALPGVVAELCVRWGLALAGSPWHGYLAVVVPVVRNGVDLALKVSWIDQSSEHEPNALRAWDGCGAVRMLEWDEQSGAMLLERLDASRSLGALQHREAAEIAGGLLRRLAIPAPPELRTIRDEMEHFVARAESQWAKLDRPFSRRLLDRVIDITRPATDSSRNGTIVNVDLHYGNVLAAERESWLVIDPKVVAGEAEFGVAQMLWTRFEELEGRSGLEDRLDIIVDAAELDRQLARQWTVVRVVDYWLWALAGGLTEDPRKCQALIDWLAPKFAG